jgi:DNA-binding NarL/FixJ family response regulator
MIESAEMSLQVVQRVEEARQAKAKAPWGPGPDRRVQAQPTSGESGAGDGAGKSGASLDDRIALVESRTFLRECVRRSLQTALPLRIDAYPAVGDLRPRAGEAAPKLIALCLMESDAEDGAVALKTLSALVPGAPIVVLADNSDAELARIAIFHGAKGYIPVRMGFEIAVEAVRFVLAGGTYVPMDYLLATARPEAPGLGAAGSPGQITARELAVVRSIQQGKSNKIIAYELNMCESTVKVHVRNLMKKLKAKNRTDVAIKAQSAANAARLEAAGEMALHA